MVNKGNDVRIRGHKVCHSGFLMNQLIQYKREKLSKIPNLQLKINLASNFFMQMFNVPVMCRQSIPSKAVIGVDRPMYELS